MSKGEMLKPFYRNGNMCQKLLHNDGKWYTVRVDKLVFATFNQDLNLDPRDKSWDIKHLDKNYQNCTLKNLKLVIL